MTITEPGIYDLSNDDYHADPCVEPSLSSSIAKVMISRSPMHAMMAHPRLNPVYERHEKTIFDLGGAAHDYLLTGGKDVVVVEADDWRTKAAQMARDNARNLGQTPVLTHQYEQIVAMAEAARKALWEAPDLKIDLSTGEAEKSLFWCDDGAWCRARLDWFSRDLELILDYKTTGASANPSGMARHAHSMAWDVQAGHYMRGYKKLIPCRRGVRFIFIVQENEAPYACSFIEMAGTFLAMGEDKADAAIREWRKCVKAQCWPSYDNKIAAPEPPSYAVMEWAENGLCHA